MKTLIKILGGGKQHPEVVDELSLTQEAQVAKGKVILNEYGVDVNNVSAEVCFRTMKIGDVAKFYDVLDIDDIGPISGYTYSCSMSSSEITISTSVEAECIEL